MDFEVPILLLVFNRPELTAQVLEKIKEIKPQKLYVVCDGPRQGNLQDVERTKAVQELFDNLDWQVDLITNFRTQNLGCGKSVADGITWFFEHEEAGIILEDDCIPNKSFFRFCEDLLSKYALDERIMHISGNNFQNGKTRGSGSYYFSVFNHIWGWATWRRAWSKFTFEIDAAGTQGMRSFVNNRKIWDYFQKNFEAVNAGQLDTWDFVWTYACWANNGISILPNKNLISNIGFGVDATHTKDENSSASEMETHELKFPLRHPSVPVIDYKADHFTFERHFARPVNIVSRISMTLRKLIK